LYHISGLIAVGEASTLQALLLSGPDLARKLKQVLASPLCSTLNGILFNIDRSARLGLERGSFMRIVKVGFGIA
jgi:hypothetical protein